MNLQIPAVSSLFGALVAVTFLSIPQQDQGADMKAMMEKAKKFTQPGENHKILEHFIGQWDLETRMFMGDKPTPGEKGKGSFHWRMDGRFLEGEWKSSMMGMPITGAMWLGYDNFKQSFVSTTITTMETAMRTAEGDLTQDGKTLILYGTLDEYLTGENDKMCKYVWRFLSPEKIVLEVHDLPIGETNTKVVEVTYTKAK